MASKLTETEKQQILASDTEGLTVKEIAAKVGRSVSSVVRVLSERKEREDLFADWDSTTSRIRNRFIKPRLIDANSLSADLQEAVKSQPTVYDVDAVIAELKKKSDDYRHSWEDLGNEDDFGRMCAMDEAIAIVKKSYGQ